MDLKQLIERNYQSIKDRGLITDKTTLEEQYTSVVCEMYEMNDAPLGSDHEAEEMADIVAAIFNYFKLSGRDPIKEFEKVVIKNEKRAAKCLVVKNN